MNWKRVSVVSISVLAAILAGCDTMESSNEPPALPSNPQPEHAAVNQDLDVDLAWECTDPDNDKLFFDIYFGTETNPPLLQADIEVKRFLLPELQHDATYYWRIVVRDNTGHEVEGPIWRFSASFPSGMNLIGSYPFQRDPDGVSVVGNYAYVIDYRDLYVIDVSDPGYPKFCSKYEDQYYPFAIAASGTKACLISAIARHSEINAYIQIIDITDPYNLELFSTYDQMANTKYGVGIYLDGNYAYLADERFGLHILDISFPGVPHLLGSVDSLSKEIDVYVSGDYAYCLSERYPSHRLIDIYDISIPSQPIPAGRIEDEYSFRARDVAVSGDYAYIIGCVQGLSILDVSDPSNPVYASGYSDFDCALNLYVNSDIAYVYDDYQTISLIDISSPVSPFLIFRYYLHEIINKFVVTDGYIYVAAWNNSLMIFRYVD